MIKQVWHDTTSLRSSKNSIYNESGLLFYLHHWCRLTLDLRVVWFRGTVPGIACSKFLWASAASSWVSSDFLRAATSFFRNAFEARSKLILSWLRRLFNCSISVWSLEISGSFSAISLLSLLMKVLALWTRSIPVWRPKKTRLGFCLSFEKIKRSLLHERFIPEVKS